MNVHNVPVAHSGRVFQNRLRQAATRLANALAYPLERTSASRRSDANHRPRTYPDRHVRPARLRFVRRERRTKASLRPPRKGPATVRLGHVSVPIWRCGPPDSRRCQAKKTPGAIGTGGAAKSAMKMIGVRGRCLQLETRRTLSDGAAKPSRRFRATPTWPARGQLSQRCGRASRPSP